MVSTTIAATARNSDCQFCNDSNQNCAWWTYPSGPTGSPPFTSLFVAVLGAPVTAWSGSMRSPGTGRMKGEGSASCSYTAPAISPPCRTGHGVFGSLLSPLGSSSRWLARPMRLRLGRARCTSRPSAAHRRPSAGTRTPSSRTPPRRICGGEVLAERPWPRRGRLLLVVRRGPASVWPPSQIVRNAAQHDDRSTLFRRNLRIPPDIPVMGIDHVKRAPLPHAARHRVRAPGPRGGARAHRSTRRGAHRPRPR